MEPQAQVGGPPYRDRQVGLVLFGLLAILLGILALCGAAVSTLAAVLAPAAMTGGLKSMTVGVGVYVIAGVSLVWLGVGSTLARRWARALMLIAGWFWLIVNAITAIAFVWLVPTVMSQIAAETAAKPAAGGDAAAAAATANWILGCVFVFMGVLMIAVPLAFVLFYRSPHVKATCEARDPRARWTDRSPLPILALSLFEGLGAVGGWLSVLVYQTVVLSGFILTGAAGVAVTLALSLVLAWAAWATWKLDIRGWWAALALVVVGAASAVGSIVRPIDWRELYREMGMVGEQYDQIATQMSGAALGWLSLLGVLAGLVYLLWVKRFFRANVAGS